MMTDMAYAMYDCCISSERLVGMRFPAGGSWGSIDAL